MKTWTELILVTTLQRLVSLFTLCRQGLPAKSHLGHQLVRKLPNLPGSIWTSKPGWFLCVLLICSEEKETLDRFFHPSPQDQSQPRVAGFDLRKVATCWHPQAMLSRPPSEPPLNCYATPRHSPQCHPLGKSQQVPWRSAEDFGEAKMQRFFARCDVAFELGQDGHLTKGQPKNKSRSKSTCQWQAVSR